MHLKLKLHNVLRIVAVHETEIHHRIRPAAACGSVKPILDMDDPDLKLFQVPALRHGFLRIPHVHVQHLEQIQNEHNLGEIRTFEATAQNVRQMRI